MKNTALVIIAFILTLTFTASDLGSEKGNMPEGSTMCPYLQNLQHNHSQLECPYLSGTEGSSSCPYMKEKNESQTGCPYLDEGLNTECPYLKEKGLNSLKKIIYYPLPEGKNS
jgi:hypothetical protein